MSLPGYDSWKTTPPDDFGPECEHCGVELGHYTETAICGSCEEPEEHMTIDLAEYARNIRNHDWSSDMSDSWAVSKRGQEARELLASQAHQSANHARLWELGCKHHGNFTWESWATDERGDEVLEDKGIRTRPEVWEGAWRWIGAYLWVHGIRLSEEKAKVFVGTLDGHRDWYDRRISTARQIDWKCIDAMIEEAC